MGDLADLLGLDRTSLTRSAALLGRAGWIGEAASDDARHRRVRLTPAGRRRLERAFPAWQVAQAEVERQLVHAP